MAVDYTVMGGYMSLVSDQVAPIIEEPSCFAGPMFHIVIIPKLGAASVHRFLLLRHLRLLRQVDVCHLHLQDRSTPVEYTYEVTADAPGYPIVVVVTVAIFITQKSRRVVDSSRSRS